MDKNTIALQFALSAFPDQVARIDKDIYFDEDHHRKNTRIALQHAMEYAVIAADELCKLLEEPLTKEMD